MSTTSTAQWDAELGVWVGERAPFCDQSELPNPLYILGYGSLIWRPGELLEKCTTFKCTALGSMRIFAQKSCDHRGTPEFPGLVLNLVKDEILEELGYREPDSPQSEFRGMVWLVPPDMVQEVIEDLDYRERGGYYRHTITVKLDKVVVDGHNSDVERTVQEETVQALVYTGAPSNPNFHLPKHSSLRRKLDSVLLANAAIETDTRVNPRMDPFDLHRRNIMTDTIAAAVGPSGPNVDYLCNLERFLNSSGMHDPFLTRLATSVRLRLGPWRSRLYRAPGGSVRASVDIDSASSRKSTLSADSLPFPLLGWGSNEFLQLSNQPADPVDFSAEPLEAHREGILAHRCAAASISTSLQPVLLQSLDHSETSACTDPVHNDHVATATGGSSFDAAAVAVESRFVVAGGGTSAVLENGVLRLWGKLAPELLKLVADTGAAGASSECTARGAAVSDPLVHYERSVVIEGVAGIAIGNDHLLLLLQLPVSSTTVVSPSEVVQEVQEVVVVIGSDTHGQCSDSLAACAAVGVRSLRQSDLVLLPSRTYSGAITVGVCSSTGNVLGEKPVPILPVTTSGRVLKLAVGMRHCALATEAGDLVTWGDARHGQCLSAAALPTAAAAGSSAAGSEVTSSAIVWRPESGARVADVACGARHTVLLDSLGVAYQLGVTARDAAERRGTPSGVPSVVQGLPDRVRWQRVTSGWSHVVLRGLSADADRSLVFYAWGKRSLSQYPSATADSPASTTSTSTSAHLQESTPVPLCALPGGRATAEVWCGSEFTLAADVDGSLWGCGWNEHGNLGVGAMDCVDNVHSVVATWQKVVHAPRGEHVDKQVRLTHIWEGAVACGGGHVLCLPK